MAAQAFELPGLQARMAFAGRKFHAWWEGYAFDPARERAALAAKFSSSSAASGRHDEIIAQAIWGEGRLDPGSPAWTMRFARILSLPIKANVIVFGAGAGASLNDLRHGTKWKVSGLTRAAGYSGHDMRSYDEALQKLQRASAAGALSFFEMSSDADPAAFSRLAAELLLPGAKLVFVDFAVARKGARLRSCFPTYMKGAPRTVDEYERALSGAGFSVNGTLDETATYLPLITQGWSGWRRAYDSISQVEDMKQGARLMRALAAYAHLWAERFDALKSGQLRVMRIQATRD